MDFFNPTLIGSFYSGKNFNFHRGVPGVESSFCGDCEDVILPFDNYGLSDRFRIMGVLLFILC